MMRHVLDALLSRMDAGPGEPVVLGRSLWGHPLRVRREVMPAVPTDGAPTPSGVMVYVEIPEAPGDRAELVLCRWRDSHQTVAYNSTQDVHRPRWTFLDLLPHGVRMRVQWPHEEAPRQYDFAWDGERPVAQSSTRVRARRGRSLRSRFLRRRGPWRSSNGEPRP